MSIYALRFKEGTEHEGELVGFNLADEDRFILTRMDSTPSIWTVDYRPIAEMTALENRPGKYISQPINLYVGQLEVVELVVKEAEYLDTYKPSEGFEAAFEILLDNIEKRLDEIEKEIVDIRSGCKKEDD